MTSSANSEDSCMPSKTRSSKIEDNYLKELNEDLKLRKQELLEMLKPLENKNNLLLQKLMSNLEEKQNSLQIMRQIMAGKGSEESTVMDLIKEAEEMKQNLVRIWRHFFQLHFNNWTNTYFCLVLLLQQERKNKMLRKEMEMLWNKTFDTEEYRDQLKIPQMKNKADSQDAKNDFHGKVMELRIGALKNYQKVNDLKLSLYLQQNSEPKQTLFNLGTQGTMATTTIGRATTSRNDSNGVQNKEANRKTRRDESLSSPPTAPSY
ncbi:putative coiled-coil domain-containing protein 196 [Galemys pyrenaicus]|uniref:Putative coiled-coil domain-containing protein 196 n=1 Tax=Galemys pyrenaicus TaxID=202257 RepID=A0A8J6DMK2_GALPY|nr:putative coiled-coil domain-containing protein 196 [Galemys pyrenaicus]